MCERLPRDAADLMRLAHDSIYRLPAELESLEVAVVWQLDTDIGSAWARFGGHGDLAFLGGLGRDDTLPPHAVPEPVHTEVRAMLVNRMHAPFETAFAGREIVYDTDGIEHPLGTRLRILGDAHDWTVRIRDGRITQLNIRFGATVLAVTMQQYAETRDGRLLPVHTAEQYWYNHCGAHFRSALMCDQFTYATGLHLPSARQVITCAGGCPSTMQIRLDHHRPAGPLTTAITKRRPTSWTEVEDAAGTVRRLLCPTAARARHEHVDWN